jgi:hypothetical protein
MVSPKAAFVGQLVVDIKLVALDTDFSLLLGYVTRKKGN